MVLHAKICLAGALALALYVPVSTRAQGTRSDSVAGRHPRHAITLATGMLPRMRASGAGAEVKGALGGLSYTFWPTAAWGIELAGGVHSAEASAWETHAVTSLLFGINWYPGELSPVPELRPYLGVAAGSYMASETHLSEVSTQNVAGFRLGGGVDVFPARWFRLGLRGAYHLTPDFDRPMSGLRSASGPELSLQLGVAFGHRE